MTSSPQVDKYCRLCLLSDPFDMPVPINHGGIRSSIAYVLGIEIRISEKLPSVICHHCLSKLEFFRSFKKEVEKSFRWLRDFGLDDSSTTTTTQPVERTTPKNKVTKSCPSCSFKTGNPVDYRKHQEEHQENHQNESEKEDTYKTTDNVPNKSSDKQSYPVTYFPCLECNMYLISSREKLLEHKISVHGWQNSDSSKLDGESSRKNGESSRRDGESSREVGETGMGDDESKEEEEDKQSSKEEEDVSNKRKGNEKARESNEESTDSNRDPMLQQKLKKRSLSKKLSHKKLNKPQSSNLFTFDSYSSDSSTDNIVKSNKRKTYVVNSSSDNDDSEDDGNAKNQTEQQKSSVGSCGGKLGESVGKEQGVGPDSSGNEGSDEDIQSLIDNHVKSVIKDFSCTKSVENSGNSKETPENKMSVVVECEPPVIKPSLGCESEAGKGVRKASVACNFCDKLFPSISILESHKRRFHHAETSVEKKGNSNSSAVKIAQDGKTPENNGPKKPQAVKRLQDGGRIVKRTQNVRSVKRTQNERSVKRTQDGDGRGGKRPRKSSSSGQVLDGDSRVNIPQDSSSSVKKPHDGSGSVKKQSDGSSSSAKKPQVSYSNVEKTQDINSNVKKVSCDKCNGQFLSMADLQNHKCFASSLLENKVKCNLCDEKFPNVAMLLKHKHDNHKHK